MHFSRTTTSAPHAGLASQAYAKATSHDGSPLPAKRYENFDLVKGFKLNYADVRLSRWRSRVTGLNIVHLDYEAPIVDGYFAVRTEIFNDSGCPHTLEHLVFMGSQKYPYKGIIDHFANRGFSNGTNAWTDTDNTVYTVSTAGGQGFLQLLPIYVDHILYPTMTKAGFVTEVHHIDGKGQDSGVVYSEMQGRQNTSADLMSLEYQRVVNPDGSAYRSETAGLMEALRKLTVEQIRDYHGSYYVPHNLSLIVTGKLSGGTESLLRVVQEEVEPSLIERGQNKGPRPPGWRRPFLETPSANRPPLEKTIETVAEFPERDESVGELVLGYMGPAVDQYLERKALDILSTYLTSSSVAPLNKEFIETDNPLCTDITFDEDTRATRCDLPVYISSVPAEHLDKFPELFRTSLTRIANEGIDMKRMSMVLNRDRRQLISKLEHSKSDMFATVVITDFLLGPEDGSGMDDAFEELEYYNALQSWKSDNWAALLRKYYIDAPCAIVIGKPSSALAERLEKEEETRIASQVKELGLGGLAKAQEELDAAKDAHEKPIPEEILQKFPVPDVKSISWIPVQSVQEGTSSQTSPLNRYDNSELLRHINADGAKLPFSVQFDHVNADFATVYAFLSMEKVPNHLRKLIIVYLSSFFSLPVTRYNGEKLSHEEVVHKLDDETVAYQILTGTPAAFSEILRVSVKVEKEKYEEGVQWLRDLIYRSEFTPERLSVILAKILQSLPELKRDGNTMMSSLHSSLLHDESSTTRAYNVTTMLETVPQIAKQLEEDPQSMVKDMEEFRAALTTPAGIRFAVAGDILSIPSPRAAWLKSFGDLKLTTKLDPVQYTSSTLSEIGKNPKKKAIIMGLPTIESSFATHTCKSIQGFNHPEYPALRVAVEVLNATEGFLWRYIRGSGLAYGANIALDLEAGHLSFVLYRSSNSMEALAEGAKVVRGLVDGSITLEDSTIDSAKSAIVYSVTKRVATPTSAAVESFVNQSLKSLSQTHNIDLLSKFQAVSKSDVLAALKKHFLPLFDAETSVAVVATSPGKVKSTVEGLEKLGFEVEERSLGNAGEEEEGSEHDESGSEDGSESDSDVSMR